MQLVIKGDLDREYFQERAVEVLYQIEGEEDIDFTLVIIDDISRCQEAAEELLAEEREEFVQRCEQMVVSTSFVENGNEYIVVRADKPFLWKNAAAARGLIAHELMHTILRDSDLDHTVHAAAKESVGTVAEQLVGVGVEKDRAVNMAADILQTAVFMVKDLVANTALIQQGLAQDLLTYYTQVLELDEYVPAPQFYGESPTLKEVQQAIVFELQLMPSWLPFKVCNTDHCSTLIEQVQQQYEEHLEHVAAHLHHIEDVYTDHYHDQESLVTALFPALTTAIIGVVQDVWDGDN